MKPPIEPTIGTSKKKVFTTPDDITPDMIEAEIQNLASLGFTTNKEFGLVLYPNISEKTAGGLIKGEQARKEEIENSSFFHPLLLPAEGSKYAASEFVISIRPGSFTILPEVIPTNPRFVYALLRDYDIAAGRVNPNVLLSVQADEI